MSLFSFKVVPTRVYLGMKRPSPLLLMVLLGLGTPLVVYFFYGALSMAMKRAKKPLEPAPPPVLDSEALAHYRCDRASERRALSASVCASTPSSPA